MNEYLMRPMTRSDVDSVIEWAGLEGWNPGLNDAACFFAADPGGFYVGLLEGEPVAAISAVRYGRTFGFIGLYIVRPEHRGSGYGLKLWSTAMASLEGRNIGLDGVVEQQENYRKSGFGFAYRNIRFEGRVASHDLAREFDISELSTLDIGKINAYDRGCFFEERRRFTRHWIDQPGAFGFGVQVDGSLQGYGVIRPLSSRFQDRPSVRGHIPAGRPPAGKVAGLRAGRFRLLSGRTRGE